MDLEHKLTIAKEELEKTALDKVNTREKVGVVTINSELFFFFFSCCKYRTFVTLLYL